MKKLMMTMALAALTAGATYAQDAKLEKAEKTPAERAKAQTEHMVKELGLTDDQATKVQTINLKYAEKLHAVRTERQAEREAGKKPEFNGEGKAIKDAHNAELQGVLTPEQYATWKTHQEEKMERRKEHMKEKQPDRMHDSKQ